MPRIAYGSPQNFRPSSLNEIAQCNEILAELRNAGYDITLRQLYYQMVSRGFIENNQKSYKCLGDLVNNARLGGLIDWFDIVDRTRNLRGLGHWDDPADIVKSAVHSFHVDRWSAHAHHVEIWVEKDALSGIVAQVANKNDVSYFSCRGYTSQSEMWGAGQRLARVVEAGKIPIIIHLGDHDPSGVDMSRDITDRVEMFMGGATLTRIALNMDQVRKFNPPPNPAKVTDSRAKDYIKKYGHESWELDALNPATLTDVIQREIDKYKEPKHWAVAEEQERAGQSQLERTAKKWHTSCALLDLEMEPAAITKTVENLTAAITAKDELKIELASVSVHRDTLQEDKTRLLSEMVDYVQRHDRIVGTLNGEIKTAIGERDAARTALEGTQAAAISLNAQLKDLQFRLAGLEK